MKDSSLKYIFGVFSTLLFVSLIYKLTKSPGGLILPGYYLGSITLVGLLIISLIVSGILKLIFKSISYFTHLGIVTSIAFLFLQYYWYSPTLKIVVPRYYTGQVALILSNVDENILTVNNNGIGYITNWTFKKTYVKPIVTDTDGKILNEQCVGFNPSTFWAMGSAPSPCNNGSIRDLAFEIVPKEKVGQKQYYDTNFHKELDSSKLITHL